MELDERDRKHIRELEELLVKTNIIIDQAQESGYDFSKNYDQNSSEREMQEIVRFAVSNLVTKYVDTIAWGPRFSEDKVTEIFQCLERGRELFKENKLYYDSMEPSIAFAAQTTIRDDLKHLPAQFGYLICIDPESED